MEGVWAGLGMLIGGGMVAALHRALARPPTQAERERAELRREIRRCHESETLIGQELRAVETQMREMETRLNFLEAHIAGNLPPSPEP